VPAAGAYRLRGLLAGTAVTNPTDAELFTTATTWTLE